jgi:DNA-binding SARP family transcriptional activator/ATP/maltotriose-dependent transcriptional regulator MalT
MMMPPDDGAGGGVSQLPRYHLARPRLTDALRASPVGVIVGGGGYGKSLLAAELSDLLGVPTITVVLESAEVSADLVLVRLRSAVAALGLSDVAAQIDRAAREEPAARSDALFDALTGQPALVVVDEIQHASPDAIELLAGAATRLAEPHRLLLIGRHAPAGLEKLAADDRTATLGTSDLALTDAELGELCRDGFGLTFSPDQTTDLRAATDGWLAAVVMLAARSDASDTDFALAGPRERSGPAVLSSLVDGILRRLSRREQAALIQASHLPLLDDDLVEAATGIANLLVAARSAGLPLSSGPGGTSVLIGPVRDLLMARAPAHSDVLVRGARAYAARGDVGLAADLLIGTDHGDAAAELLADLTSQQAEEFVYAELAGLSERLPEHAIARHPRVLLHLARVCAPAALTRPRAVALERAGQLAQAAGDAVLARDVGAEVARDLVWADRQDEAVELASGLLAQTGAGEELTRARLLEVLGRAASFQKDDVHLGYAEERMQIAASTFRAHQHWSWLSVVMMPLAIWVHVPRGSFDAALRCLDESLALVAHQPMQRGVILTFRAEVLDTIGRYDEAADNIIEAREINETLHDPRLEAYIEWDVARGASQQGDVETTLAAIAAVEAASSDWFDSSGCLFLCDAANYLDRLGLASQARDYLARAKEQSWLDEPALGRAEAAILARSGDPEDAERHLQALLGAPWFEPRENWSVSLFRAHAATRRGDSDAARLATEAFAQAARLGYPQLPLIQERAISEELLALAASSGRLTSLDLDIGAFPVVISMLGRFEVTQGGRPLDIPAGQGRQLLKLIASAGGTILADQVIEHLWPDIDAEVGANRLRTVLGRLREAATELVVRDERSLRLAPHVHTDSRRFEEGARRAEALAAARSPEAVSVARSALAIYRGDLLPDDPYESWTTMPRERLRRHAPSLLDVCADAATGVGDLDEAVRCLVRATDLAPYEEERYLAAARHLLAQGRRGAARSYVDQARTVLDELGLSAPAALVDLDRLVRRA